VRAASSPAIVAGVADSNADSKATLSGPRRAALASLVVLVALSAGRTLLNGLSELEDAAARAGAGARAGARARADSISDWEQQLAPVAALTPPQETLAYDSPRDRRRTIGWLSDWYASQYALVPRLLEVDGQRELALANYPDTPSLVAAERIERNGYEVAWTNGRGLALLKKAAP
jgi:hypothetical protein